MKKVLAVLGMIISAILAAAALLEVKLAFLAWVALIPFLYGSRALSPRQSFFASWLAGTVFFSLIFYWLAYPVYDYGGSFRYLGLLAMALLYIIFALFWGLFGYGANKILSSWEMCPLLGIPALWTALELLRRTIFFSLPLGFLGFSQAPYPKLIQSADLFGVLGISFLIALVNTIIFLALKGKLVFRRFVVVVVVLVLFLVPYTAWRMNSPQKPALSVGLVQGNTPQEDKWSYACQEEITNVHLSLSRRLLPWADVIVWPESAIAIEPFSQNPLWTDFLTETKALGVPLIFGMLQEENNLVFNSSLLIDSGKVKGRYDKLWLVPFGEFIPFPKLLGWVKLGFLENTPGKELYIFEEGPWRFATPICYEILSSSLMRQMGKEADVIFNLSNETWFKNSHGLPLLWSVARLRAVEIRRPIVKAANTGYSGYINDLGQAETLFPDNTQLSQIIPLSTSQQSSPYVRLGDWPLLFVIILSFVISGSIGSGFRRWGEPF